MARQFANTTGQSPIPTSTVAAGSYVSPTEIYRQKAAIGTWPFLMEKAAAEVGSYYFAASSGSRDTSTATGNFLLADGSAVSRTTYSTLFNVIGTTYGSGDGSTTFNLPNLTSYYNFLKTTTVSGLSLASISGTGVVPYHTHTHSIPTSTTTGLRTDFGSGGGIGSVTPATIRPGIRGSTEGNIPRHRQVYPLICISGGLLSPGLCFPFLSTQTPNATNSYISTYTNTIVASGQAVSRSGNPSLFGQFNTLFGSGDGSTTFNLPDFTGLFLRNVNVTQVSGSLPSGYVNDDNAAHDHVINAQLPGPYTDQVSSQAYVAKVTTPATGISSLTGKELRPDNIAVVYLLVTG